MSMSIKVTHTHPDFEMVYIPVQSDPSSFPHLWVILGQFLTVSWVGTILLGLPVLHAVRAITNRGTINLVPGHGPGIR